MDKKKAKAVSSKAKSSSSSTGKKRAGTAADGVKMDVASTRPIVKPTNTQTDESDAS